MVGHGGCSAGSYLADPTSPIPSHRASIVATSTLRVNDFFLPFSRRILTYLKYCILMRAVAKQDLLESDSRCLHLGIRVCCILP